MSAMSTFREIMDIAEFVTEVAPHAANLYEGMFNAGVTHYDSLNAMQGGTRSYTDVADSASNMLWCNP